MDKKTKLTWRLEEIVSYLEERVSDGTATNKECEIYEDYCWTGKLVKNESLRTVIKRMNKEWEL